MRTLKYLCFAFFASAIEHGIIPSTPSHVVFLFLIPSLINLLQLKDQSKNVSPFDTPYKHMDLLYSLVHILLVTCNQNGDSDSLGKLFSNPCQCSFHFWSTCISVTGFNLSATLSWLLISHHMGFSANYNCTPLSYVHIQVDLPKNIEVIIYSIRNISSRLMGRITVQQRSLPM